MKFKNTQELFESFPDTVLLVGNGKIENKGELIDSYECVIRFNDFVIEGYEQDVGTKISAISFHNAGLNHEHTKHLKTNYKKYVNVFPIFTTHPPNIGNTPNILKVDFETSLFSVYPPISNNPIKQLSSGISLALNLALFFSKEVHLIGFDFWKSGHYYDAITIEDVSDAHIAMNEAELISKISTVKLL